ncbi:sigma 54-interacting transcriptional regulator [Gorillibacterium massiliense]|uniref:sigma-54-dependent Fis family transcriptional regulator n=1 Tax=Gorillibacterium massiliense TaxID=1280390 RepID=UPI0004B98148|nr:sigma 54-interacting transcriptional regulator [Gorillibacterium massiliense]
MQLKFIQNSIQQVVVAIASALKIEVEVADRQLFRVAGTGAIKSNVWQEMRDEDYVYRRCMDTGEPVIIENPGQNELCRPCLHFGKCPELGEVCCPIKVEDTAIGVIGLIALQSEQKERLFGDLQANLSFLQKMAELIASKMIEYQYYQEQLLIKQKISTLVHYLDHGIVMIDREGRCDFINPAARKLLYLGEEAYPDPDLIAQFLKSFGTKNPDPGESVGQTMFFLTKNGYRQLYVNFHHLDAGKQEWNTVIVLQDPEQIATAALQITEGPSHGFEEIIGKNEAIVSLKELMRKTANSRSPILIHGESGTGKQFFAQSIHHFSERRDKPFITLNCAVLSEDMLQRQLFGEPAKGTNRATHGALERAGGGTLFLDDIAEMPLSVQLTLLKVLEERAIRREDSAKPIPLELRLIAATDKNLEDLVAKGSFRQDLYYKLNVIPLFVPSLKDRREDILPLARYFLDKHARSNRKSFRSMDDGFQKTLVSYHWPGNIRELSNVIEYAVNIETNQELTKASMPAYLRDIDYHSLDHLSGGDLNLRSLEKEAIRRAVIVVKERGEAKDKASELLGIGRATLFRKLQEYGL